MFEATSALVQVNVLMVTYSALLIYRGSQWGRVVAFAVSGQLAFIRLMVNFFVRRLKKLLKNNFYLF